MSAEYYAKIVRRFGKLVRSVYRVEVEGIENVPAEGALLICSNHLSMADVLLIASVVPRQITFLAKEELFKMPLIGRFVKKMGAVPIKRGSGDVGALKQIINALAEGKTACVYPQGHRMPGKDPELTPIQHGVGLIEWRAKADILPIAFKAKNWRIRPFRKTKMIIGPPLSFNSLSMQSPTPPEYQRAAETIFKTITRLLG